MGKMTKWIPLWFKEPVSYFFQELRYQKPMMAFDHAWCSFVDLYPCSEKTRMHAYRRRQRHVDAYLTRKYAPLIKQNMVKYSQGFREECFPIWMFWSQGEDAAPELVKLCIQNTRKMAGTHPVHVISLENYREYIQLSDTVSGRLERKEISLTHFSDILRMNLLASYGGLWLDATIFCTKKIEGAQFDLPVFSGKNPGNDFTNVSNWNWTTYAMFGWKENILYSLVRDVLNAYLEEHAYFIDYYVMDHTIRLVESICPQVKQMLKDVPVNNTDVYYLNDHFEQAYSPELAAGYKQSKTWLYKLTWKKAYATSTAQGEETLYAHWLKENCNRK